MIIRWLLVSLACSQAGCFSLAQGPQVVLSEPGPLASASSSHGNALTQVRNELIDAIDTLQDRYFDLWLGSYPSAIDWTAALIHTHLTSSLHSLSNALTPGSLSRDEAAFTRSEWLFETYFSQSTAYYFGQDAISIRTQAYDDMQWLVLGWLQSVRFTDAHSRRHYPSATNADGEGWHGKQWTAVFAHRARVFYDIVASAWDDSLCGGGLTWNPRLPVYKNAITNTQFITASIGMYLFHPGDNNTSPFLPEGASTGASTRPDEGKLPVATPRNVSQLHAAIRAYSWLKSVHMRDDNSGLIIDGFHISDAARNRSFSQPSQCDQPGREVYTYNQGVLLGGLRGLFEATGERHYLGDGHQLIEAVFRATGWRTLDSGVSATDVLSGRLGDALRLLEKAGSRTASRGGILGHGGILEETCDPSGSCGQDPQAFKGAFASYLADFCAVPSEPSESSTESRFEHIQRCAQYAPWVALNARAALETRDEHGVIGGWWGAALRPYERSGRADADMSSQLEAMYEKVWLVEAAEDQKGDPNNRGRGRTVESHASGLAIVRACFEMLRLERFLEDV